jgi:hypothetical protein
MRSKQLPLIIQRRARQTQLMLLQQQWLQMLRHNSYSNSSRSGTECTVRKLNQKWQPAVRGKLVC